MRMIVKFIAVTGMLMLFSICHAAEPALTIQDKDSKTIFTRSQLETRYGAETIVMNYNRAYPGKAMLYRAVKLCDLLRPYRFKPGTKLELVATDGFVILIPADKLLRCGKNDSIAYLAIEPKEGWPLLPEKYGKNVTAGPFDIIWVNPGKSHIPDEYWAWSVVAIRSHQTINEKEFVTPPKVVDAKINARLQRGYEAYMNNCAGCHTLNHVGKGKIGRDLNDPKSPVQYFASDAALKKFIRDPGTVPSMKDGRMSGISPEVLPDNELNDLIYYFHYMAKGKKLQNTP